MDTIKLDTLAGGAVAEKFNLELEKVLANCMDPNTDFKKARKITLNVTIKPNEERDETGVQFEVKSTIAPSKPVETRMIIGLDEDLKVQAAEYQKGQLPGQTEAVSDPETGEVVYRAPEVVDFRTNVK